jgi:hypothetical protein
MSSGGGVVVPGLVGASDRSLRRMVVLCTSFLLRILMGFLRRNEHKRDWVPIHNSLISPTSRFTEKRSVFAASDVFN